MTTCSSQGIYIINSTTLYKHNGCSERMSDVEHMYTQERMMTSLFYVIVHS